ELGFASIDARLISANIADVARVVENFDREDPSTFETCRLFARPVDGGGWRKRGPRSTESRVSDGEEQKLRPQLDPILSRGAHRGAHGLGCGSQSSVHVSCSERAGEFGPERERRCGPTAWIAQARLEEERI